MRGAKGKALSRRRVVDLDQSRQLRSATGWPDRPCAASAAAGRPMAFSIPPFCQGAAVIAEEGLRDRLLGCEPIVQGKLGAVVEGQRPAHRRRQGAQAAMQPLQNGPRRLVGQPVDQEQAGAALMDDQHVLAEREKAMRSASQWPATVRLSASRGRWATARRCLMKLAGEPPRRPRRPRRFLRRGRRRCQ